MHELVIRPDWAQQIGQLRERLTEDTNIIRWGNSFYRCCRNGAPVTLRVATPDGSMALPLQLRSCRTRWIRRKPEELRE